MYLIYVGDNRRSEYTEKWAIACPPADSPYEQSFWIPNNGIYMDKIMILTDGNLPLI